MKEMSKKSQEIEINKCIGILRSNQNSNSPLLYNLARCRKRITPIHTWFISIIYEGRVHHVSIFLLVEDLKYFSLNVVLTPSFEKIK